jgi:hypothetical protein
MKGGSRQPPPSTADFVDHFIEVIEVSFGFRGTDRKSLVSGMVRLWEGYGKGAGLLSEDVPKWLGPALFSAATGMDSPPDPLRRGIKPLSLLAGSFRRYVRRILMSCKSDSLSGNATRHFKALQKAQTLLNLKRGAPTVTRKFVQRAGVDHMKTIGDRTRGLPENARLYRDRKFLKKAWHPVERVSQPKEEPLSFNDILIREKLHEVVDEIFPPKLGKSFHERIYSEKAASFPSISGYVDSKSIDGGSAARIGLAWSHSLRTGSGRSSKLHSMSYHPHVGVLETRINPRSATKRLVSELDNKKQSFDARFTAIKESLKARIATCGPSWPYFCLRPIQQLCWARLSQHRMFRLVGHTCDREFLEEIFPYDPEKWFLSGDYKQATDLMRRWVILETWNRLADNLRLENWERRIGAQSLCGHRVHYSKSDLPPDVWEQGFVTLASGEKLRFEKKIVKEKGKTREFAVIRQANGQLMGGPLSFVTLCLVNAALCSQAYYMDMSAPDLPLSKLPILINGDDCVMQFTPRQKAGWYALLDGYGFESSVGKTYWAPSWLQINSQCFYQKLESQYEYPGVDCPLDSPEVRTSFEEVPFVNYGYARPHKSKGGGRRPWSDIGQVGWLLLEGAFSKDCRARLLSRFLANQRSVLAAAPAGVSWWIPKHLGGLGLPILPNRVEGTSDVLSLLKCRVSYRQQQLSSYLVESSRKTGRAATPIRGMADLSLPTWLEGPMRWGSSLSVSVYPDIGEEGELLGWNLPRQREPSPSLFPDFRPWDVPGIQHHMSNAGTIQKSTFEPTPATIVETKSLGVDDTQPEHCSEEHSRDVPPVGGEKSRGESKSETTYLEGQKEELGYPAPSAFSESADEEGLVFGYPDTTPDSLCRSGKPDLPQQALNSSVSSNVSSCEPPGLTPVDCWSAGPSCKSAPPAPFGPILWAQAGRMLPENFPNLREEYLDEDLHTLIPLDTPDLGEEVGMLSVASPLGGIPRWGSRNKPLPQPISAERTSPSRPGPVGGSSYELQAFSSAWKRSKKVGVIPLEILMTAACPITIFPGGLVNYLERCLPCPRGIASRRSAKEFQKIMLSSSRVT